MSKKYSVFRNITAKDMIILKQALRSYSGFSFEPLLVSKQLTAGTNYCFIGNGSPVIPEAEAYPCKVMVHTYGRKKPTIWDIVELNNVYLSSR